MKRRDKPAVRKSQPDTKGRELSPARKWIFRGVAMSLPVLLLGLLEIGLRLGGYGYDPSFFRAERDSTGAGYLVNNDEFTFRFFPPELSRCAPPFKITATKEPGVIRIFVFGESAAMGDPQPSVGPTRILETLLREKFCGQKFEVVNLGITAINSHVIVPMAREVAAHGQGDIWILYMGNNEMVGPFGAATVFGSQAAPLWVVRLNLAVQRTRVGQLSISILSRFGKKSYNAGWGGMKMFLENQVQPDDPRRETVCQSFEQNLNDILNVGAGSGAGLVLSTVSVNLRNCPPFGSASPERLVGDQRGLFLNCYTNGIAQQDLKSPQLAVQAFASAAEIYPKHAEIQFRLAQNLEILTNHLAAREHYQRACNLDTLPFRADGRINGVIRKVARKLIGERFEFCDSEAALAAVANVGIAGDESFFEHVHFNFAGNYRLARAWAERVEQLLPKEIRSSGTKDWAGRGFCQRAIGLSDWNRMAVIATVQGRMQQPPFVGQFTNQRRLEGLYREQIEVVQRMQQPAAVSLAQTDFLKALERAPDDNFLRENFATFLRSVGDKREALTQYQKIVERLPHDFYSRIQMGRLLGELGRWPEAEDEFTIAARQRPQLPDAWFELGLVHAATSNHVAALANFERALRLQPADISCRTHKARTLAKLNRTDEAIREYRSLIQSNPERWEAHLELAELFAVAGQSGEAIPEYEAAAKINPRHAEMRLNLGVMLAREKRFDDAIAQFRAVLELSPTNRAAKNFLDEVTRWRGTGGSKN